MRKKKYAAAAALALCWSGYRVLRYPIHHSLMPINLFVLPGRMLSVRSASAGNQMIRRMTFPEPDEGLQRRIIHVSDIRLTVYERPHHGPSPCLLYIHGCGFCFEDAPYIHRIVMRYAKEASCTVVFVHYRTSDRHPYPIPFQDCCTSLDYVWTHHAQLNIDPHRIAVGGDSAGGCLAALCAQWARDHAHIPICFQLLIYPVTDLRMSSPSMHAFKDSPFWNAKLNERMWKIYLRDCPDGSPPYAAPMQANDLSALPDAYIETEEFDCLRDEGVMYAERLRQAGADVQLEQVRGTFHGFDFFDHAKIADKMIRTRIQALNNAWLSVGPSAPSSDDRPDENR